MKVLLRLSAGLRPDRLEEQPFIQKLMKKGTYCMTAQTVMPSVTLPCHMSLFHSVEPSRHGVTTNTYTPQVRPVPGLFEQLAKADKKCAFFYNWEELRDLSRPGSLFYSEMRSGVLDSFETTNQQLCDSAEKYLNENDIDFTFLYLGWTDGAGHSYGWMSDEYQRAVTETCKSMDRLLENLKDEYTVILTADHGGHDRIHGENVKEDMTIPVFLCGAPFAENREISNVSILDLAPTITQLLDAKPAKEWEGHAITI